MGSERVCCHTVETCLSKEEGRSTQHCQSDPGRQIQGAQLHECQRKLPESYEFCCTSDLLQSLWSAGQIWSIIIFVMVCSSWEKHLVQPSCADALERSWTAGL